MTADVLIGQGGEMKTLAMMLAATVLLGACGDADGKDDDGDTSGTEPRSIVLDGRVLEVTDVTASGEPREIERGSRIVFTFDAEAVSIHAGCNTMRGSYELAGDELTVGMLASTKMACPEPLMAQDAWLAAALEQPLRVGQDELVGSELTFAVTGLEPAQQ